MKITFVIPAAGVSGGIRTTVCRANALVSRGHEVRILYKRRKLGLRGLLNKACVRLIRGSSSDWLRLFGGEVSGFNHLADCRFARGEVLLALGSFCALEVDSLRGPFGAKVHCLHGALPGFDTRLTEALRLEMPKILVANYLTQLVRDVSAAEVLGVVPGGVDQSEYFPPEIENERLGVGGIFAKAPFKGPDILIAVLDRLSGDMPSVPQYVFGAGRKPGGLRGAKYMMLPSVEQARAMYGKSTLWFVTSRHEGFGAPILEAMACGCAVISTDCGGPREIIQDGENGFLVPVDDVEAFVRLAKRLLLDKELRQRIVGKALGTVKEYTWQRSIDMLEECLRKAVSREDGGGLG